MRKSIALTVLLSFTTFVLAAQKGVRQPPAAGGITIPATFVFFIQGDGISTTFTITPSNIPQNPSVPGLPHLPLAGIINSNAICLFDDQGTFGFAGTVSGSQLIVNFPTAPPSGLQASCSATLLFRPQ